MFHESGECRIKSKGDGTGDNIGQNAAPINRIYLTNPYSNKPIHVGVGDVQIWDGVPSTLAPTTSQSASVPTARARQTIKGTPRADTLGGGAGNDTIGGSRGGIRITGGQGDDIPTDGQNYDTLVFATRDDADRITDFVYDPDELHMVGMV